MSRSIILTTQPGWAFATLAELQGQDTNASPQLHHRDSTLSLAVETLPSRLHTPEAVFGSIASFASVQARDATQQLERELTPAIFKVRLVDWLSLIPTAAPRRYSLHCELWGRTALRRNDLADFVRRLFRRALPAWRETKRGGLQVLCKADPQFAVVGVRLYSNFVARSDRAGSLRPHLAASLLALAGVSNSDVVLDPFMGSGTILQELRRLNPNAAGMGADIDPSAVDLAAERLGANVRILAGSFDKIDVDTLPSHLKLVSNLPFGVQFKAVSSRALIDFLRRLRPRCSAFCLLMGRSQGSAVSSALGLEMHNVLVLGQPACIVQGARRIGLSPASQNA